MGRTAFDPIALVEAFYTRTTDDQLWLAGIADALQPLDRGLGLYARVDDQRGPGPPRVILCVPHPPLPENFQDVINRGHAGAHPEVLRCLYAPTPPVSLGMERFRHLGGLATHLWEWSREVGIGDAIGFFAHDPAGRMLHMAVLVPVEYRIPPRLKHQLTLTVAHAIAGLRLRSALAGHGDREDAPDAVLDPESRLCDARGDAQPKAARLGLADAVRRLERARGKCRRVDPEEALSLWQGLVDGRWSLVDHHDTDGRRYVLARRNEPAVRDPKALTSRERAVLACAAQGHQNKYIGYMLGLAPSTVAAHLKSAGRKLRAHSRRELIQMFAAASAVRRP